MSHFYDAVIRFWPDLIARPSGPLAFRFVLQPVVACALAIRDGIKDARQSHSPYFWIIWTDVSLRKAKLHEGIRSVGRVLILAAAMDVIYQIIALHALRPLQTLVIAVVLAFIPYLVVRGPANRVAKHWMRVAIRR